MVTGGMFETTEGRDLAGLGHAGREVAAEEAALRGVELHAVDVRAGRRRRRPRRSAARVGLGRRLDVVGHQAADGDDRVALLGRPLR